MVKKFFLLPLLLFLYHFSFSQDTLPLISVTKIGNKVLVSWVNNFSQVTNINIQRSYDSVKNFRTIGSVLNVKAINNGFVDAQEFATPEYYRVFISFEGGNYMFSKVHKPVVDSARSPEETVEVVENHDTKEPDKPKEIKNVPPLLK